jgi:hypothetical protein
MTDVDYRRVALRVLAKVKAYDPRTSTEEPAVAAWAEHLAYYQISNVDELLRAVQRYFLDPHAYVTQPAHITGAVRDLERLAIGYDPYNNDTSTDPDEARIPASQEHRRRCMAEITETLGKRFSVPL